MWVCVWVHRLCAKDFSQKKGAGALSKEFLSSRSCLFVFLKRITFCCIFVRPVLQHCVVTAALLPPPWLAFIFSLISSPLYRLGGPRPLCWEWFGPYGRKDCVLTRVFWSLGVIFCVQQSLGFCLACQATNVNDPDSKKAGGLEATARRPNARKCATMWILNLVFRVSLASLKFYAFADFALFKKKNQIKQHAQRCHSNTTEPSYNRCVYFHFFYLSHCS